MRQATRGYVCLLLCFLVVVMVWAYQHPQRAAAPQGRSVGYRVDVNSADAATLELLPGVGPSIAENIVLRREELGGFAGRDDLMSVRYIGPKLVRRIEPWVVFGEGEAGSAGNGGGRE